jgi:hypothetical protein
VALPAGRLLSACSYSRSTNQISRNVWYCSTVEPGYNDIGLYETSPILSDFLWCQFVIPHC